MEILDLTANGSQALDELAKLNKSLGDTGAQFIKVTSQINTYNEAGEVARSVTEGIDLAGRKMRTTFASIDDELVLVSSSIKSTEKDFQNLKTAVSSLQKFDVGQMLGGQALNNTLDKLKQAANLLNGLGNSGTAKATSGTGNLGAAFGMKEEQKEVKTLASLMKELSATYSKLRVESEGVDRAGKTLSATLKGVAVDGRNVAISLKTVDGELQAVNTQFTTGSKSSIDDVAKLRSGVNDLNTAIGGITRSLNYFVTYKAFALISDQIKEAFNSVREFQIQISLIRTLSQENQLSFSQWAREIKNVSDELGTPLQDVAEATFLTISNQVAKGQQAIEFVKEASNLSRVTGATTTQTANLLSSAINAYGKSASDATELSALFFKTIDEGRIVAGELSDSFGGVAVLGNELGVSLNDLSATLAFITQSGVRTDTAMTFLRNTFLQLQKPSETLISYFNKIGVSSGKAAITAAGSFGKFALQIAEEIKAGNVELAKAFPELRGEQAIAAIVGRPEAFDAITKKFNDTAASAETLKNALSIREESDANSINKELNKLANTITVDIGTKLASLTKELLDFVGGGTNLATGLNRVLQVLRVAGIAFVVFRTTVASTGLVISVLNTALGLTAAAHASTAVATNVSTAATLRFNAAVSANVIGLAITIGALVGARKALAADITGNVVNNIDAITEANKKRREEFEKKDIKETPGVNKFLGGLAGEFAGAAGALARFQQDNNAVFDSIQDRNKAATAAVGESFKGYIDSLKTGVQGLKDQIKEIQNILAVAAKGVTDLRETIDNSIRGNTVKFATDAQKLRFFDEEISRTQKEAERLFNVGDRESIEEANRLLQENIRLRDRRLELEVEGKKLLMQPLPPPQIGPDGTVTSNTVRPNIDPDFANELRKRRGADFKGKRDGLGNPLLEVDIPAYSKELDEVYKLNVKLKDKLTALKKEEAGGINEKLKAETARIKKIEDAFKAFNEFSAFDKGGNIKGEFKDKLTGRLDVDKVKAAVDATTALLKEAAGSDFGNRLKIEELIGERRKAIIEEVGAAELVEIVRTGQAKLDASKKEFEDKANNNKKAITDAAAQSEAAVKQQRDRLDSLKSIKGKLQESVDEVKDRSSRIGQIDPENRSDAQKDFLKEASRRYKILTDFSQALQEYETALDNLQNNRADIQGQRIPKADDIVKTTLALENAKRALDEFDKGKGFADKLALKTIDGGKPGDTAQSVIEQLRDQIKELKRSNLAAASANTDQMLLEDQFKTIQGKLDKIKELYPEVARTIAKSFSDGSTSIINDLKAFDALVGRLEAISPKKNGNLMGPPLPPGFNDGGFVGGRPGVDTNLARLSRGEYVVNARSAYQFADVLQAINRTRGNVTSSRGGDIMNTRVGDIVINYSGSGSADKDGRALANTIERQLRRGNLKQRSR